MWRTSFNLLRHRVASSCAVVGTTTRPRLDGHYVGRSRLITSFYSTAAEVGGVLRKGDDDKVREGGGEGVEADKISCSEAKRLMRLVNVEALKMKLGMEDKEVIAYEDLLEACKSLGVAKTSDEAASFARVLDEAGIVLLFRDKVYLHPDKVVDLVRKAVPLALLPENHPSNDELKKLQEKKEVIDALAHKQVRRILWTGLGLSMLHVGLFFRLTFWEFSWDVMEPIAFFATASGIVVGYAYFLFTSRDPTYQDFMKRLFISRQKKLVKKYNFDVEKFNELQMKCKSPLDLPAAIKHRIALGSEHNDLLRGN